MGRDLSCAPTCWIALIVFSVGLHGAPWANATPPKVIDPLTERAEGEPSERLHQSLHAQLRGRRLGSGMGGSAASAVAAVVALNQFLEQPLSSQALLTYALQGEGLSCAHGRAPADNVVPCLYGGLTLSCGQSPYDVVQLPMPDLNCILVHPHLTINTKDSRGVLDSHVPMDLHVNQSANLAYFLVALYEKDYPLMQRRWKDVVVEPQRSSLITGFSAVQQAAIDHGALGASLSGSGPSMFAWAESHVDSQALAGAMSDAFLQSQVNSDCWVAPICEQPAYVMEVN